MMEFVSNYWGLLSVGIGVVVFAIYDWNLLRKHIIGFIFVAEERARKLALETGEAKYQWVVDQGYLYLPTVLKPFINKELFAVIVQYVFDKAFTWAKNQELPGK